MTTKEAWIHPHPMHGGYVILPDGYEMGREEAESNGYKVVAWPDTERTAAPHPHEKGLVVLPRGQVMSVDTANSEGFALSARLPNAAADPNRSWRSAIMSLPEARDRTSATAELLTTQSHETMSIESARAFLRGLPTEQPEKEASVLTTNANDPRAARLAEIQNSMAAINKNNGYRAKPVAQAAPSLAHVDATKLKRFAEIRLNALESDQATPVMTNESKKLRYALQVHSQTGMPLAAVFTQLGVDTSKIIRS